MNKKEILSQLNELPVAYSEDYVRTVWPLKEKKEQARKSPAPALTQAAPSPVAVAEPTDYFTGLSAIISDKLDTRTTANILKDFRNMYAGNIASMSFSDLATLEVQLAAYLEANK